MKVTSYLRILVFIVVLFLSVTNVEACNKKIVVTGYNLWVEQFNIKGATYIIIQECDLKGGVLIIPVNSCLKFEGGIIKNGRILGNNTNVIAEETLIFQNISLLGTWKNRLVFGKWLDFVEDKRVDNVSNFQNLMMLCKGDVMTHLYMQKGVFYCAINNIRVPSNVYWHNEATICQLPTDSPKYGFVVLHKSDNVTIDGGTFVGDVKEHIGQKGEWGHGIKLAGATNVTLKNLVVREFWGDGIDLIEADYVGSIDAGVGNCHFITIENIKSLYNRRQGMSIEAAEDVLVTNSEFAYTGKIAFTRPGTGVDIEPWCHNENKVKIINFKNCYFHDNVGGSDLCFLPNAMFRNSDVTPSFAPNNAISVRSCRIGRLYVEWVNNMIFKNCEIDNIVFFSKSANVLFSKNHILNRSYKGSYEGAKFIKNK